MVFKYHTLELYNGSLDVNVITTKWYKQYQNLNYGAVINFIGVVRDENGIDGLSFDIYEPMLKLWFDTWIKKAKDKDVIILMAHSIGDVLNHECSYIATICSKQRRLALDMIDYFVEDFKANATIWKYDLKNKKRIYAEDRSKLIKYAGVLNL